MFPQYEFSIRETEQEETPKQGKTFAYDFVNGDFLTRDGRMIALEGADALKAWAEKCIRTEAQKYLIYRQDEKPYGVQTVDLRNRRLPLEFICAEIEREITEALLYNPNITGVRDFSFERQNRTLSVNYTIDSIYGTQEVNGEWQMV